VPNPFDFFDDIQCISLDHHPDRWEEVKQEFRQLGICERVVRFSATENDKKYGFEKKSDANKRYLGSLCHREIVKSAKARKLRNVLIFEDDVSFLTYDLRYLSDAIEQLKEMPSWQLFYLGMNVHSFRLKTVSKNLLFGKKGRPAKIRSTHAYSIHHSAFDRVLTYPGDGQRIIIDVWLPENFDFFCLSPLFSVQDQGKKSYNFQKNFHRKCGRFRGFFRVRDGLLRRLRW
jgi:hypothetical protein